MSIPRPEQLGDAMNLAERIVEDPGHLLGRPASEFHALLAAVDEALARRPPSPLVRIPSDRPIQVIGDSHGDYVSVNAAIRFARGHDPPHRFVGLGDYINRGTRSHPDPPSLPNGSVANVALLLAWSLLAPDDVTLLRGNHEASRQFPVALVTYLRELRRLYPGPDALALFDHSFEVLERLPVAAATEHGVFLAHGGIPPRSHWDPKGWRSTDLALLEGLLWSDPEPDYEDRGAGFAYSEEEFDGFLDANGWHLMIKGHSANDLGRIRYGGRLLTIHTSDIFTRFGEGGILLAEIPAGAAIRSASEIVVRRLAGENWGPYLVRSVASR